MQRNNRWMILLLMIIGLGLASCTTEPKAEAEDEPVHLEPVQGSDLHLVVISERAAERLDLETAPVRDEVVMRSRIVGGMVAGLPLAGDTDPEGSGVNVEVADPGVVWVSISLNESDLNMVDQDQPALVTPIDMAEGGAGVTAHADGLMSGVNPGDTTTTLFYRVEGADHNLSSGERVLVELTLSGSGMQRLVIPYAAVLYDLHGDTWVYIQTEPLTFIRSPIVVDYIDEDIAILLDGPPVGTQVVTNGATELFGTEFGVGGH
ncbi:MAG: hypothetical protein GTO18_02545 [Anaerolineales bacterium]|nr:hypothetical protein [Anaerolineales bacterium]